MGLRSYVCILLIAALNYQCSRTSSGLIDSTNITDFEYLTPIPLDYGDNPQHFGELWLPENADEAPVVMIIHGGCWLSQYNYNLMDSMAYDLATRGFACWNLEYRRTENIGGGWPGTFLDVSEGLKYLKEIDKDYPIDINKIILSGHSAGGHLALWLGCQVKLDPDHELFIAGLPDIHGIVSLAGIVDLESYYTPSGCGSNVINLIGGTSAEFPDRYTVASPISHLPLGIPQILINGEKDNIVSLEHVEPYFQSAQSLGDDIKLKRIPNVGHFEIITPGSQAWPDIIDSFEEILKK